MTTFLVDKGQGICLEKIQTLYYSSSPGLGEKVGQFSRVHIGRYSCGTLECYGARIETFVHADDGHTGPGLPGHNGAFDGGSAAVFRQERGVYVVGAFGGGVEGFGTQDLSVGCDDQGVVIREFGANLGDAGRLAKGEVVGAGKFGDGGSPGLASPALSGVWLGDHEPHLVGGGDQTPKDGRREVWGTGEGDLQGVFSALLGEQLLPPLAHGCLARLPVGAVQNKDAVEVVDLVLQDPG